MRNDKGNYTTGIQNFCRLSLAGAAALLACTCVAKDPKDPSDKEDHYQQVNLVSDLPQVAQVQDTNLVNAWGISFSSTSPFWISDNGTGKSTLYVVTNDASGEAHVQPQSLVVNIPGEGTPTGQFFDGTGSFHGDIFVFASEDGTISGWRGALGTHAEVLVSRPTAVYKGITRATNSTGVLLLAANFGEARVDVYRTNLTLVAQYTDPSAPVGYAPFNVQNIGGIIFVTYAKQDSEMHDDVPGPGNGLIDTLDPETGGFTRLATGSNAGGHLHEINSPWGMAVSPNGFGKHSDELLVGNFGSGTILSFDSDGKFRGLLKATHGGHVKIDGLWGLTFGNGKSAGVTNTLYFSAGPDGEGHGLFGSLAPATKKDHDHHDNDNDDDE